MKKPEDDKRQRILEAAIAQFAARGFENASIADIAGDAGIAKGTVYLYFPSKDALIDEVFDYCQELDVLACDEGLDQIAGATAKLCKRMENALRFALTHPKETVVERMYVSSPPRPGVTSYLRLKQHFASVDAIMKEGVQKGELKDLPATLLGEIFFSVSAAFYFYLISNPGVAEDASFWEKANQTVRDCLAR